MGLFKTPLPPPPGPRSKGSSSFSIVGDTISRLGEASGLIANIWNKLAPYSQKTITAADGRRFNLLAQDAGYDEVAAAGELAHPWKIYLQKFGTEWKVGVDNHSDVYDGVTWTNETVTGLLTNPLDENDEGWAAPQVGFLFLWGTVDENGEVTEIEIKNDQAHLDDIKRVDSTDGKQTQFAYVLGYLWSEQVGNSGQVQWYVRQEASRHVTLMHVVVNGVLCKVPFEM